MDTKRQSIIVSILLVISIAALLIVRSSQSRVAYEKKKDVPSTAKDTADSTIQQFTSADGSLQFQYPKQWSISFTTPKKARGEFGPYVQTWKVTSFHPDNVTDQLPENAV